MMQDATNNKFDMIITKSISRFGRNTVDTLKYVRLLKEKGIAIYFEEERINTLEISGEIMLTVLSAMAQQESENISSHVKLGLQMKQKRGELILKEKIDKLINLNLNGTITLETLQEKKAKLQNKINSIDKEQEHLQLELEDSISLNQGLNKFKTLFKDNEIMPEFDKDVFELMIEKVIIGEKEQNGDINPRVITFILKSGNEIKCKEDNNSIFKENLTAEENKNQQSSYEVSQNYLQPMCEPCGVRSSD